MNDEDKKTIIAEFDHLMSKCNLGHSALDGRAIRFINEFERYLK